MVSLAPFLHLMLCLMAVAPTAIQAAPVIAHNKVVPLPAASHIGSASAAVSSASYTNTAKAIPTNIPTSTIVAIATGIPSLIIPTTDKSGANAHVLPATVEGRSAELEKSDSDIPPLVIPVADESGDDAHVLHSRSPELIAAIRSQNSNSDIPRLAIPVTDEAGNKAHIVAAVEGRSEKVTSAKDTPLVITTEDDSPNCADNRGGCDLTTA